MEEQFYFLFPTLVVLGYGPRASRASQVAIWKWGPISLFACTFTVSLGFSTALSVSNQERQQLAFYLLPSRFWQLVLGAILYEITSRLHTCPGMPRTVRFFASRAVRTLAELVTCTLGILAFMLTDGERLFPVPWSLLGVGFAVGSIFLGSLTPLPRAWAGRLPSPLLSACLGCTPFAYIGRISYPLYLWHWPVFVCCRWSLDFNRFQARVGAWLLTFMLATLTYHGVELRVQRWKPRKRASIFFVFLFVGVGSLQLWLCILRGPLLGSLAWTQMSALQRSNSTSSFPMSSNPSVASARSPLQPPPPLPPPSLEPPSFPDGVPLAPPPPPEKPPPPSSPPPPQPKCVCSNNEGPGHTFHSPPHVDPRASTSCFTPKDFYIPPNTATYFEEIGRGCFGAEDGADCWSRYDMDARCMTPGAHFPPGRQLGAERAVFLIGDSHANAFLPGLIKTVQGKMTIAAASGPGYIFVWAKDERFLLLEANLQKGDVVMLVQAAQQDQKSYYGPDQLAFIRWALVPLLESRGAKLLLFLDWYTKHRCTLPH